jgi:hypothetical protein
MWMIIIVIILFALIIWRRSIETFSVVPQNSNIIKVKDDDMFQAKNNLYNSLFISVYGNVVETIDKRYNEFPSSFVFGYNNLFKDVVLSQLKSVTRDNDIRIVKDIDKVFWIDLGNTRRFIFEVEFGNKEFIHLIKVYLNIDNIGKYGIISGNTTLDNPVVKIDLQDIKIISMKITKPQSMSNNDVQPFDPSTFTYFYKIRNRFGLMDPFVTDGRDMQIYDYMKENFNKVLNEKNK